MVADGCGYNHLQAADFYQHGIEGLQTYEQFDVQLAMSTFLAYHDGWQNGYQPDSMWTRFEYAKRDATDSAASATSMASGRKVYYGSINVDLDGIFLENIVERASTLGKATGVVSSVEFSHGTPAGISAHNENRFNYSEIAHEMIYDSELDVIMGAGHPFYDDSGNYREPTQESHSYYIGGVETYQDLVNGVNGWSLIESLEDFQALSENGISGRVFGLPRVYRTLQYLRGDSNGNGSTSDLPYEDGFIQTVPTLSEMSVGALNCLNNHTEGFFLMIEGGAVDWAGHGNKSGRLIEEMIDFNTAVNDVVEWIENNSNWDETLIIVASDHEAGYLTGPGSGQFGDTAVYNPIGNNGIGELPEMQWNHNNHTNVLIPLFAHGASASILTTFADEYDPVRGRFISNSEIGQAMFQLWPTTTVSPPKNIILVLGDGMGYNHIEASDLFLSGSSGAQLYHQWQQYGISTHPGTGNGYAPDETWGNFEKALSRSTDNFASLTAIMTGKKTGLRLN